MFYFLQQHFIRVAVKWRELHCICINMHTYSTVQVGFICHNAPHYFTVCSLFPDFCWQKMNKSFVPILSLRLVCARSALVHTAPRIYPQPCTLSPPLTKAWTISWLLGFYYIFKLTASGQNGSITTLAVYQTHSVLSDKVYHALSSAGGDRLMHVLPSGLTVAVCVCCWDRSVLQTWIFDSTAADISSCTDSLPLTFPVPAELKCVCQRILKRPLGRFGAPQIQTLHSVLVSLLACGYNSCYL